MPPPRLKERYLLGERLGEGGFGETFAATDESTNRRVVVKILRVKGLPDWKPVELLEREAKVLASLDHPGVPEFVDAFEEEHDDEVRLHLVAERIEGKPLDALISEGKRWSEGEARALLASLLETLVYLHGLSPPVVHRDVKPGNIVVRPDGGPVLVDFGAVRDLAATHATAGLTVMGTPGYMAPEQALGQAGPASDLYGLGTTMLHALTHRHPTELPKVDMVFDFARLVGLPGEMVGLLQRLAAPDPAKRFRSAQEALAALRGETTALAVPEAPTAALAIPAQRTTTPAVASRFDMDDSLRRNRRAIPWFAALPMAAVVGLTALGPLGAIVGLGIMATSIGSMFGYAIHRRNQYRELYANGTHAVGTVVSASSGQRGISVEYEFKVGDHPISGSLYTSDFMATNALKRGDPVHIFHTPGNPAKHVALLEPELTALLETESG